MEEPKARKDKIKKLEENEEENERE